MSNSWGKATLESGEILGYCMYQGSADIMHSALFESREELNKNWRTPETWRQCKCEHPEIVNVEIYSDYGHGGTWPGKACKICKTITDGLDPYEER